MPHPLQDVPLNIQMRFIRGIAIDGCEIFVPVHIEEDVKEDDIPKYLTAQKTQLQDWLDTQYEPPKPSTDFDPFDPSSGIRA